MLDKYLPIFSYFIITVVNAYWTWQTLKMRNKDEAMKVLQNQIYLKDKAINELMRKKNEYKRQYENLLSERQVIHGENKAYKRFHGHDLN